MKHLERIREKLYNFWNKDIGLVDWVIYGIIGIVMCLFFQQGDIVGVAETSFQLLDGHILNFYDVAAEFSDGMVTTNYLLPTYILFAIWNLPLKLLGKAPLHWAASSFKMVMWYKALPVLFFLASAYVLYRILTRIGMSKRKSKIGMYLYLTSPIAMFSQYFFGQYDSFTVFFMLLGLYYYFRNEKRDWLRFILISALAFTFKYFVVAIILPLLLLREKRIERLLLNAGLFLSPYLFLRLVFQQSENFQSGVVEFAATDFLGNVVITNGSVGIQIIPICFAILCAFAYFKRVKEKEEETKWAVFYCGLVCILLFGLMNWHPQWVIFGVPFWTMGLLMSIHYEIYLWLELAMSYLYCAYVFNGPWAKTLVNPWLTLNGLLGEDMKYHYAQNIAGKYYILTMRGQLFSYLAAIIFVIGICRHPKTCVKNLKEDNFRNVALVRARYVVSVLLLLIPNIISIAGAYRSPKIVQATFSTTRSITKSIFDDEEIGQYFIMPFDLTVNQVNCMFDNTSVESHEINLELQIIDAETNEVLCTESYFDAAKYNGYTLLTFEPVELKKDHGYKFLFHSDAQERDCLKLVATRKFSTVNDDTDHGIVRGENKKFNFDMILCEGDEYMLPARLKEKSSSDRLFLKNMPKDLILSEKKAIAKMKRLEEKKRKEKEKEAEKETEAVSEKELVLEEELAQENQVSVSGLNNEMEEEMTDAVNEENFERKDTEEE